MGLRRYRQDPFGRRGLPLGVTGACTYTEFRGASSVAVRPDSPVRRALDDPDAGKPLNHRGTEQFEMLLRSQTIHAVDL